MYKNYDYNLNNNNSFGQYDYNSMNNQQFDYNNYNYVSNQQPNYNEDRFNIIPNPNQFWPSQTPNQFGPSQGPMWNPLPPFSPNQPNQPNQQPPFTPGPQNPQSQMPKSAPPSFTPQEPANAQAFKIDAPVLAMCLFRFTYIWPRRGNGFWFYPIFLTRNSVAGFRWTGRTWVYSGIDLNEIRSFQCF